MKKEREFVTDPECVELQVIISLTGWGSFWVDDIELVEVSGKGGNLIPNGNFEEKGRNCYLDEHMGWIPRAVNSKAILNSMPELTTGEISSGDVDRYDFWCWRMRLNNDPDITPPNKAQITKSIPWCLV